MKSSKKTKPAVNVGDGAIPVRAEIVVDTAGTPVRQPYGSKYRAEYCDRVIQMFEDMLAASGEKLEESIAEETRSKSEASPARAKEAEDKRAPRSETRVTERRTVRRNEWRLVCAELPSMNKFGRLIGVSKNTLINWRAQYPTFDEACCRCIDMLEDALVQRGLRGQYDPEMVKFVGKNWAGMKDRHEITGAEGAPLNPPVEFRTVPLETLNAAEALMLEARRKLLAGAEANG